jgi:hypothetical protein
VNSGRNALDRGSGWIYQRRTVEYGLMMARGDTERGMMFDGGTCLSDDVLLVFFFFFPREDSDTDSWFYIPV